MTGPDSGADSGGGFDPEDYPPESQTGRGPYRISWWAPNRLAGVEIWPERGEDPDLDDPDSDDAGEREYFMIRIPRPAVEAAEVEAAEADRVGAAYGFRRRCGWCGVVLRSWQRNLCQRCGRSARSEWGGPPVASASRWDAAPDSWPWQQARIRGRLGAWQKIWNRRDRERDHES